MSRLKTILAHSISGSGLTGIPYDLPLPTPVTADAAEHAQVVGREEQLDHELPGLDG
jgi:hypothetical protein